MTNHLPQALDYTNAIAQLFAKYYYNVLCTEPDTLHRFYGAKSSLSLEGERAVGATEIGQKWLSSKELMNNGIDLSQTNRSTGLIHRAKILHLDAQRCSDYFLIQVHGQLTHDRQSEPKTFMQSFVLAPFEPNMYYVLNDIFRLLQPVHPLGARQLPAGLGAPLSAGSFANAVALDQAIVGQLGCHQLTNVQMPAEIMDDETANDRADAESPDDATAGQTDSSCSLAARASPNSDLYETAHEDSTKSPSSGGEGDLAATSTTITAATVTAAAATAAAATAAAATAPAIAADAPSIEAVQEEEQDLPLAVINHTGSASAVGPEVGATTVAVCDGAGPPVDSSERAPSSWAKAVVNSRPTNGPAANNEQNGQNRSGSGTDQPDEQRVAGPPSGPSATPSGPPSGPSSASPSASPSGPPSTGPPSTGPSSTGPSSTGQRAFTDTGRDIFVGNIPEHLSDEVLIDELTKQFGQIQSHRVIRSNTRKPPYFAFVTFASRDSLEMVKQTSEMRLSDGYRLNLEIKRPRDFYGNSRGYYGRSAGAMGPAGYGSRLRASRPPLGGSAFNSRGLGPVFNAGSGPAVGARSFAPYSFKR